jgi:NitT/TauT family transport system permease protein
MKNFLKRNKEGFISLLCGMALITVLVIVWELTSSAGWEYAKIVPPPSKILSGLFEDGFKIGLGSQAATIQASILATVLRVLAGMLLGISAAFIFGFFVRSNIWLKRFLMPLVRLFASIAPVAWISLALILIGIGNTAAIFIVFMGVFFTMTIAVVRAIEVVPENLINSARTMGATRFQVLSKVVVPAILPNVFTALRLNFIAAWIAVLAAEMVGLNDGIGAILNIGRNLFEPQLILLGMILIGGIGFVFDVVLKSIQNRYFWWDGKK